MRQAPLPVPAAATPAALARLPQWPLYLEHAIERGRARPFDWTAHNCATFAADCVAAVTGVRLHGKFAGLMANERRARAFGRVLAAEVDAVLGAARRVPPTVAQRGDVVLVDTPAGSALAVCVGAKAAAVSPDGLVFVGMEAARCAWHI